jgi:ankyrin repeat protein
MNLILEETVKSKDPKFLISVPFHYLESANVEVFELLLKYGANINYTNKNGDTPLVKACCLEDSNSLVELFKSHGAEYKVSG